MTKETVNLLKNDLKAIAILFIGLILVGAGTGIILNPLMTNQALEIQNLLGGIIITVTGFTIMYKGLNKLGE